MKRVKAACICQTLHFLLKEDLPHDMAVRLVRQEVDSYKAGLERKKIVNVSAFFLDRPNCVH